MSYILLELIQVRQDLKGESLGWLQQVVFMSFSSELN